MRTMLLAASAALSLVGCAGPVTLTPTDTRRAVSLAPFTRLAQLGQITVGEGVVFFPASIRGEAVWCSGSPVFFAPMEAVSMCMVDPAGNDQAEGWFTTAILPRPAAVWRFDVDIPYRVTAAPPLPPRR